MEAMEHNDAVRLQAVEKYMLGELSPDVRDEFEAHFFDCAVCSFNLRAGIAFATGARQFFTEDQTRAHKMHQASPGWLAWLKPLIAAPIMAALLLVVGYQYFSTHGNESSSEVQAWYSLNDSTVHGSSGSHIEAQQGKAFHLMFDIPDAPQNIDATLRIEVRDSEGKVVLKKILPSRLAQKSVILDVPANFKEGNYRIIVYDQTTGSTASVQEFPFTVAFSSQVQQH
jgi:hypothetical protein